MTALLTIMPSTYLQQIVASYFPFSCLVYNLDEVLNDFISMGSILQTGYMAAYRGSIVTWLELYKAEVQQIWILQFENTKMNKSALKLFFYLCTLWCSLTIHQWSPALWCWWWFPLSCSVSWGRAPLYWVDWCLLWRWWRWWRWRR